jgi:hypothetical protein
MATAKLTFTDTTIGAAGVVDNIKMIPGSFKNGSDPETPGGSDVPHVNTSKGIVQSFSTVVVATGDAGITMADAMKMLENTESGVALASGTTGGHADLDCVGYVEVNMTDRGTQVIEVTVTGNPS